MGVRGRLQRNPFTPFSRLRVRVRVLVALSNLLPEDTQIFYSGLLCYRMSCVSGGETSMARIKRSKKADLVFEGVVIPKRTRSAKIAAKGIANEEDMGRFLTAIFSDTLKGEIVLPKPGSRAGASSKLLDGLEQKLKRGLPVTIQALGPTRKRSRKAKPLKTKEASKR